MDQCAICEACEDGEHWQCDGQSWDTEEQRWRQCECTNAIHDDSELDTGD